MSSNQRPTQLASLSPPTMMGHFLTHTVDPPTCLFHESHQIIWSLHVEYGVDLEAKECDENAIDSPSAY